VSKALSIGRRKIIQQQVRPGVIFLDPVTLKPIPQPLVMMQRFERDDYAAAWQNELGRKVTAEREKAGLSQAELSRRSSLRQPHISAIETGQHDLRVTTVFALARALGVKADRLFPETQLASKPEAGERTQRGAASKHYKAMRQMPIDKSLEGHSAKRGRGGIRYTNK
jgi:transcriptional regulator with XRE-family HTH domain